MLYRLRHHLARTPASHLWKMVGVAVVMLAGADYITGRFIIGHDPQEQRSLAATVYLVDRYAEDFERGDYAAFTAGDLDPKARWGRIFVKQIAAGPGDTVRVADGVVTVRGTDKGTLEHGLEAFDAPASAYARNGPIGAQQYWMMGSTAVSFDSRYFGAVPAENMIGKVYPVY